MANKVAVIPNFRLGVDGKLFKVKNTNKNIQETTIFHTLLTRLSIFKGDLPLFPDLGLKQHLGKFNFTDESQIPSVIANFELDVENQMGRSCTIDYTLDKDAGNIQLSFSLEGMEYSLDMNYSTFNGSIKPINYQFDDQ